MLTIGAVAQQAGVRPSTLRYCEVQGILRPSGRLANGYRMYDDKAVTWLRLIRRAQALGLTLGEIKEILNLARQGEEPCCRVKELVRDHLHEIDQKIQNLQVLQAASSTAAAEASLEFHGSAMSNARQRNRTASPSIEEKRTQAPRFTKGYGLTVLQKAGLIAVERRSVRFSSRDDHEIRQTNFEAS